MTWVPARKGNQPWRNFYGADITRAASRGKPWWHAERQGGPLWMQPQVLGRDKEDGRVAEPEDIRVWTMTSFAAGATGVLNLRWRPLLDGPLFGAFGSYGMDGSRTPRSDMASAHREMGQRTRAEGAVRGAAGQGRYRPPGHPGSPGLGLSAQPQPRPETYAEAMWGAYRGFFDNGIQADWVHIDDIERL